MSTESQVIEELVLAGAAGDREAQQALLQRYWPVITQVVRARRARMRRDVRDDTGDLIQEVAIEILRSLPGQRWQGRQAFVAWIRKLADYELKDIHRYNRRQKRDRRAETNEDKIDLSRRQAQSMESRLDNRQQVETLMNSIESLKPEYGAALMLHYAGYAHAEIGQMLDCSAEAARKLVARARAKLVASR